MNMISKIAKSPVAPSVGDLLTEARHARGYSLDDVAETTGLTVAEVTARERHGLQHVEDPEDGSCSRDLDKV
jgi:hypothetical protein